MCVGGDTLLALMKAVNVSELVPVCEIERGVVLTSFIYHGKNYYIMESFRTDSKKSTSRIVRKLGTHEQLRKEHADPEAWAREIVAEMNRKAKEGREKIMVPFSPSGIIEKDDTRLYDGGYLFLQKLFYRLHLDYICKRIAMQHDFSYNLAEIMGHLVYGRILNPASKLSTYEYAKTFLEEPDYELNDVYRALDVIGEEKDSIQAALYQFSKNMGKRNDSILYYDCTNYYFEIEQESGIRKYGPSKEHRPNPIVEMGLFMDGDGIPLAFCIHSGNTNESKRHSSRWNSRSYRILGIQSLSSVQMRDCPLLQTASSTIWEKKRSLQRSPSKR